MNEVGSVYIIFVGADIACRVCLPFPCRARRDPAQQSHACGMSHDLLRWEADVCMHACTMACIC